MAGPKLEGRSYGLLILAVVVAMVATNLIGQSTVGVQGADVAVATREVAAATREVAESNQRIAASNARIADAIVKLADVIKTATADDGSASTGQASDDTPSDANIPATNQGMEFAK